MWWLINFQISKIPCRGHRYNKYNKTTSILYYLACFLVLMIWPWLFHRRHPMQEAVELITAHCPLVSHKGNLEMKIPGWEHNLLSMPSWCQRMMSHFMMWSLLSIVPPWVYQFFPCRSSNGHQRVKFSSSLSQKWIQNRCNDSY